MIWESNRKTFYLTTLAAKARHRQSGVLWGLLVPGLALLLSACSRPPEPIILTGETMGTYWTVRLTALPESQDVPGLQAQIGDLLDQVNDEMSTYRQDSVISQFNRAPAGTTVALPSGFSRVLTEAMFWAKTTGGAFDPTAGPLVNLWGFGPDRGERTPPTPEQIEAVRQWVGWERLSFDQSTDNLIQPGQMVLDLSGIAKGWGVDVIAEHLMSSGIEGFLVDIGGELRVAGRRPDGTGWRVGIERPAAGRREAVTVIEVEDLAIATSGNYRNFFEADGDHFSHLIDPRSGRPIDHDTVSVTVVTETATVADALATALSIMSIDQAFEFAQQRDLAVFWLLAGDGKLRERMTPAFQRLIQQGET